MKISQKQASLLAEEALKQILKSKTYRVDESTKETLRQFKRERAELIAAKDAAVAAVNRHDATLGKITGKVDRVYASSSIEEIVSQMEKAGLPTRQQIEDKIILSAMFNTEDDMEKFISKIVKEFTKSKRVAVD